MNKKYVFSEFINVIQIHFRDWTWSTSACRPGRTRRPRPREGIKRSRGRRLQLLLLLRRQHRRRALNEPRLRDDYNCAPFLSIIYYYYYYNYYNYHEEIPLLMMNAWRESV